MSGRPDAIRVRCPGGSGVLVALALTLAVGALAPSTEAAQPETRTVVVDRRGGMPEIRGPLERLDDRGVLLDSERYGERLIRWDEIRSLRGVRDDPRLDRWLDDGRRLWRARIRLNRGDPLLAEPVFDALFTADRSRNDATGLLVAEGLLRCRLARGAHAEAMEPYFAVLRIRSLGVAHDAWGGLPSIIDAGTGLVPDLVPAWASLDDHGALVDRLDRIIAQLRERARRRVADADRAEADRLVWYAEVYRWSAAIGAGRSASVPTRPESIPEGDPGAQVIEAWIATIGGAEGIRGSTIDAPIDVLEAPIERSLPEWAVTWITFARGVQASTDPDDAIRRARGLVELLGIPATRSTERPYIAGLAIERAADAADRDGRRSLAEALRRDLRERFPGHPSLPSGDSNAGPESDAP